MKKALLRLALVAVVVVVVIQFVPVERHETLTAGRLRNSIQRRQVQFLLDVLVLATGFRVDSFMRPMQVTGRDGVVLDADHLGAEVRLTATGGGMRDALEKKRLPLELEASGAGARLDLTALLVALCIPDELATGCEGEVTHVVRMIDPGLLLL